LKILLIVSAFNSLTQRVYCYLKDEGYEVSVEFALSEEVMVEAVDLFKPNLIFCPYLIKKLPSSIWKRVPTFIVHPGIKGDRGASSLDWAIYEEKKEWGVTILQANEEIDAGDIWATFNFIMPKESKSFIYRTKVSDIALSLIEEVLKKFESGSFVPIKQKNLKEVHPPLRQDKREIDWKKDSVKDVIRKINASDSIPGVKDNLLGVECYLFGATFEAKLKASPKEIIAKRDGAICIGCKDGAIWISHLKEVGKFKLPATYVLKEKLKGIKEVRIPLWVDKDIQTFKEITFEKKGRVGYLEFDFYNGAMSSAQCIRLKYAIETLRDEVDILVLKGGKNFFSNGIHLTILEDSEKQGEDGWSNINAMNNLIREIIFSEDVITVASFGANAGAGGVFLGLCCDFVVARKGVVLNPHYKTMGLSGSEYHSYSLPKKVGKEKAEELLENALPISAKEAKKIGMIEEILSSENYDRDLENFSSSLLKDEDWYYDFLDKKSEHLEENKEYIEACKERELTKMYPEFWDKQSKFHKLRYNFVYKVCPLHTPKRLAIHKKDYSSTD
jgi:putative two-component system hydrogenase maturation factor HypX/HoxX